MQLMGRLSANAAIEVVAPGDTTEKRFLPPTFLKELGMPRPSAVEHYLEQPYYPKPGHRTGQASSPMEMPRAMMSPAGSLAANSTSTTRTPIPVSLGNDWRPIASTTAAR